MSTPDVAPDESSRGGMLRVGEAIVELLATHYGVDVVFGIPGVHNIEIYRGLHRSGVRAVSPRHEQGAGFMADGWSVVTGRPGVCALISGPGLTNALTPMAQAFHDSRPMLVLAATTPTDALGRRFGPLHDLDDQAAIARTVCAFSETVLDPAAIPQLIARAWDVFTSSRPRPVHLAIPTDVLEQWVAPFEPVESAQAGHSRRARPADDEIVAAAAALSTSSSPMIVAGGGAIDAGPELIALAEALDAPVVLTGNAKGVVPSSHPLCVGNALVHGCVQSALEAADLVVVVGTEISDADLYNGGRALVFSGTVVRIDIDAEQIPRRLDGSTVIGLHGDAASTLTRLAGVLTPSAGDARVPGSVRTAALVTDWCAEGEGRFAPWVAAVEAALPPDVVVALDSTQLAYSAHVRLRAEQSRSWLAPYGLGTLGCAVPMAVGAAIAAPDRPVFALAGDGGWLFTVAEMATAVDEGLGIVLALWDNSGYAQIKQSFDDVDAPRLGVDISSHDPSTIARGFGWATHEAGLPDDVTATLQAAFTAAKSGVPQFVRILVPAGS
jgi:acetolactate synthase-1/2/3 large subunit